MIATTPFYERLAPMNTTGLWTHWSGYLSALRYDASAKHEYFAVRNSVGVFDTSPLFKYWIRGRDAERFLSGVLTRDVRQCRPGKAQYTLWCDDRGFVLEDGVVFRHSDTEYLLTTARPNLGYFRDLVGPLSVTIQDASAGYGILAVQGPKARTVLSAIAPGTDRLAFFEHTDTKIAGSSVTVSRTGYTGDLGYEITVPADDALPVLDAVLESGDGHGMRPFGEQALLMTRVEAGLVLIDVEFSSSRLAYTDHERVTPKELGFGWMLRDIADDRAFIGRDALRRELADQTSRWASVGLVLDWEAYDRAYVGEGLLPPKDEHPLEYESMVYDASGSRAGYATSLMYSPVLQRHIAMARVRPHLAAVGTSVDVELTINHEYRGVGAEVRRLPLYNPQRKTA